MLPSEMLGVVCSHISKPDLKNLRLVCQSYQQAAAPFLFDAVFISFDTTDLRIARSLILRFNKHIRTLVFSSIIYEDVDKDSFLRIFGMKTGHDGLAVSDHTDLAHAEYAFGLYRKARRLQKEALISGVCQAHLSFALCRLSNLRRIVLTDVSSLRVKLRLDTKRLGSCPHQNCNWEDVEHFNFTKEAGLHMKGPSNPWRTTLLALSTTNSRISEITMDHEGDEKALNTAAFKLFPSELEDAKVCMQALVKLRLTLGVTPESLITNGETHYVHRNVSKLLRAAVNLECLALEASDNIFTPSRQPTTLKVMLGKCEFPKLRSLFLTLFHSTDAELLRFLKHSPQLEQLTLECHALASGSWALFAEEVRRALPLKSVQLDHLFGGFPPPQENTEFVNCFDSVADFFLRNGKNPFTKEAIERYLEDVKSRRERTYPSNYIETYNAFH